MLARYRSFTLRFLVLFTAALLFFSHTRGMDMWGVVLLACLVWGLFGVHYTFLWASGFLDNNPIDHSGKG